MVHGADRLLARRDKHKLARPRGHLLLAAVALAHAPELLVAPLRRAQAVLRGGDGLLEELALELLLVPASVASRLHKGAARKHTKTHATRSNR